MPIRRPATAGMTLALAIALVRPTPLALAEPAANSSAQATSQTASIVEMETWIAGLDSPLYAKREEATDALEAVGGPAVPYLRRAVDGKSLEAADRAVWVLQRLAKSPDTSLRFASLEVLSTADRFPAIARKAEAALAVLQTDLCRVHLVELGAEFLTSSARDRNLNETISISVCTNRDEWRGKAKDLLMLAKLNRVTSMVIASRELDNELVEKIAEIEGLALLTLIETSVHVDRLQKLNAKHPNLRVIFHARTKLGVRFAIGQRLLVNEVQPDSPAEKAGMRNGDRVTKFNDQPVDSFDGLTAVIAKHQPGKSVTITVDRGGKEITLTAELGSHDWWEELKNR